MHWLTSECNYFSQPVKVVLFEKTVRLRLDPDVPLLPAPFAFPMPAKIAGPAPVVIVKPKNKKNHQHPDSN